MRSWYTEFSWATKTSPDESSLAPPLAPPSGQPPQTGREIASRSDTTQIASFHHDKVKESDRETLIATRTEIIGGLPEDRRRTMMMSRMRAMMETPELEEADKAVIEKVMPRVPAEARKAFVDTMADLMKHSQS